MLANPPFGVDWKQQKKDIEKEAAQLGFDGRFGAGTPRVNDGALLFLQHMLSKMRPVDKGGSRIGIVFNGSPLFTGDAGSGESEIRRWSAPYAMKWARLSSASVHFSGSKQR